MVMAHRPPLLCRAIRRAVIHIADHADGGSAQSFRAPISGGPEAGQIHLPNERGLVAAVGGESGALSI
jgi:hypothetical protein